MKSPRPLRRSVGAWVESVSAQHPVLAQQPHTRLTGRKGQVMLYLPSEATMLADFINMECSVRIDATSLAARHRRRSGPSLNSPKGRK